MISSQFFFFATIFGLLGVEYFFWRAKSAKSPKYWGQLTCMYCQCFRGPNYQPIQKCGVFRCGKQPVGVIDHPQRFLTLCKENFDLKNPHKSGKGWWGDLPHVHCEIVLLPHNLRVHSAPRGGWTSPNFSGGNPSGSSPEGGGIFLRLCISRSSIVLSILVV